MAKDTNFVWIDLEMTGLNSEQDHILEIATIITDDQLNIIEQGPALIIHQPEKHLQGMDEWVLETHTKNGLLKKVKESNISLQQATQQTFNFIQKYCTPDTALLAGNSVWKDREFLQKYMPEITNYLFYRLIDVTSIKILIDRWYPDSPHKEFLKKDTHRALEDIIESINELQHYRKYFLS